MFCETVPPLQVSAPPVAADALVPDAADALVPDAADALVPDAADALVPDAAVASAACKFIRTSSNVGTVCVDAPPVSVPVFAGILSSPLSIPPPPSP